MKNPYLFRAEPPCIGQYGSSPCTDPPPPLKIPSPIFTEGGGGRFVHREILGEPPTYWNLPWMKHKFGSLIGGGGGRAVRGEWSIFSAVAKREDKMADKIWLLWSLFSFAGLYPPNALICSDSVNKISPVSAYYWKTFRSFPNRNMLSVRAVRSLLIGR